MTETVKKTRTSKKKRQTLFLEALARGVSVAAAAEAAGVTRSTVSRWRQQDSGFRREWQAAEEAGTDAIEDEALRRAVSGTDKPVFRGGEIVGHVKDYSDAMLTMLLKARRPERYATTKLGGEHDILDLQGARDALERKFSEILRPSEGETLS